MKTNRTIRTSLPLLLILFLMLRISALSQDVTGVKNTQAMMSKGKQSCYVVEIPNADLKAVQQSWIKKIQEDNKVKVVENDQELLLAGVVKPELTKDSVNIYSLLIQKDTLVSINVFIEIDSVFFSPKEDKTDLAADKIDNNIKNYMHAFAVEQYRLVVANELEDEEKILKTLENDLEKMVKEEENLEKDNSSYENDIEEKEREIKEIDQDIDAKRQEIMTHNASMLTLVSDVEKDAAKDKQKELEKEKNQLEKDRSKAKDDISDYKSKIEKNIKSIGESQSDQELKKSEIESQKQVIAVIQAKLEGIK